MQNGALLQTFFSAKHRFRILGVLFFLSGVAALIYEVVWLRILVRVLGCTVYATSTVLAAFMTGLALGSYFFGKRADRVRRPLLLYAALELGIAGTSLLVPFVLRSLVPVFQAIYAGTSPMVFSLARFALVFLCLVIPTTMMGGTFPVLTRFLTKESSHFGYATGTLYAANTWGAVIGVLSSGFVLIGQAGEFMTVLIAVLLNAAVASAAYALHKSSEPADPERNNQTQVDTRNEAPSSLYPSVRWLIALSLGLSGFAALGYEVVWTRMLQFFLGTSVYAFTVMLALYLIGIAWGSQWSRKRVDQWRDPVAVFALFEILISFFSLIGLWLLVPMDSIMFLRLFGFSRNVLAAVVAILPTTFCLGALFPTVSRCFLSDDGRIGMTIGRVYSTNTMGTILGSLAAGFLLIPLAGTAGTAMALSFLNAIIGIILFLTALRRIRRPIITAIGAGALAGAGVMMHYLQDPFFEITKNRILTGYSEAVIYLHRERPQATITAFGGGRNRPGDKHLWINGVGMTALTTETKLMAHMPILLCKDPKKVLIICFGMGTTLKSSVVHDVSVDVVELVADAYDAFEFFHPGAGPILKRSNVRAHVDDGRNFLLMNKEPYDVITIDPAPPLESAGSVNLYSWEFLTLCRQHLKGSGVVCLWVPPAPGTEVRLIMSTFVDVFPHATLWRGPRYPGFYLIGTNKSLQIDHVRFNKAFQDEKFMADLKEWDDAVADAGSMEKLHLLDEGEFRDYVKGVPHITDDHPYTEFPLFRTLSQQGLSFLNAKDVARWKTSHP